jgi:hypothetical protein
MLRGRELMLRGRELQCKGPGRAAGADAGRAARMLYREAIEGLPGAASPFIWPALTSCRTGARWASGPAAVARTLSLQHHAMPGRHRDRSPAPGRSDPLVLAPARRARV